jgi:hypothetical protein
MKIRTLSLLAILVAWTAFLTGCNNSQPTEEPENTNEVIEDTSTTQEVSDDYVVDYWTSEIFSQEDLASAVDAIMNNFNSWEVKCEMKKITYRWDEKATSELEYCKDISPEIDQCAVFISDFHVPDVDQEMAWAFEPNKDMLDWQWYVARSNDGAWNVITYGY